jgi:hypothetical protein
MRQHSNLGIPPFFTDDEVEVLYGKNRAGEGVAESLTGQFHRRFSEQFDLMIGGKGLDEFFCTRDPDGNGITVYTSHSIY